MRELWAPTLTTPATPHITATTTSGPTGPEVHMKHIDAGAAVLRVADSGGGVPEMEIYMRDGDGNVRSLVASGSARVTTPLLRCQDHFIAHGVCIDCTQASGTTVWAE